MTARISFAGFGIPNSCKAPFFRQLLVAAAVAAPSSAWAACATSGTDPVTLTCAVSTFTAGTTNTTSPNAATTSRTQQFAADLIGQVNTGVTISTSGLDLVTTKANGGINFTNSGAINANDSPVASALQLDGNGGTVSYSGAGTISGSLSQTALTVNNTTGNITITPTGTITAGGTGIQATTTGTGDITVTTSQTVTANNGGSAAIVTTTTSGTNTVNVTAGTVQQTAFGNGINASATTGKVAITNSGVISGSVNFGTGVRLNGGNGDTVINNGTISGSAGISAIVGNVSVYNAGLISATNFTAIQFEGTGNTLTIAPTATWLGNVVGSGFSTLQLGGPGTGTFDISQIGLAKLYGGFSSFAKVDDSTWTLTGFNATAMPWTVKQGTLNVATIMSLSSFTVQDGVLSIAGNGTIGSATVNGGTMNVLSGGFVRGPTVVNGGALNDAGTIGTATVNGGTMTVLSSGVAGPVTVNGGVLTGEGTVGNTQVNAGGTFAPGTIASAGTSMTVAGNLAFAVGRAVSGVHQSRDIVIRQCHGHRDAQRACRREFRDRALMSPSDIRF